MITRYLQLSSGLGSFMTVFKIIKSAYVSFVYNTAPFFSLPREESVMIPEILTLPAVSEGNHHNHKPLFFPSTHALSFRERAHKTKEESRHVFHL